MLLNCRMSRESEISEVGLANLPGANSADCKEESRGNSLFRDLFHEGWFMQNNIRYMTICKISLCQMLLNMERWKGTTGQYNDGKKHTFLV